MDAKAKRKALFRSKLKESEQKKEKHIDSPLVRYNEHDQPVCRVCNVTLKSETLWPAHQVSRKHHEAIDNLKSKATGLNRGSDTGLQTSSAEPLKRSSSATLPPDFFDKKETKRQKNDESSGVKIQPVRIPGSDPSDHHSGKELSTAGNSLEEPKLENITDKPGAKGKVESKPFSMIGQLSTRMGGSDVKQVKGALPENFFDTNERTEDELSTLLSQSERNVESADIKKATGALPDGFFESREASENHQSYNPNQPSKKMDGVEAKQVKGALPEGFFDNKDADLRARGIEPVKVDIDDAYKEFEKDIQNNLQEVDDRLGEEEIDAAEVWGEYESLEQMALREQVEMMKKKVLEVKAAHLAAPSNGPKFRGQESSGDSSSDTDDEEDFAVDWRAKHL